MAELQTWPSLESFLDSYKLSVSIAYRKFQKQQVARWNC